MKTFLPGLGLLILSLTTTAQQVARGLTASNGQFIGFLEYKPTNYNVDLTIKYPLIIFLHGIGERGNGTTQLNMVAGNGILSILTRVIPCASFGMGNGKHFSCYLLN